MSIASYKHQREAFDLQKDERNFAIFLEQGLGKSKVALDLASHLYRKGSIDTLLILAPNGVHLGWEEQVEVHLDPSVKRSFIGWPRKASKRYLKAVETSRRSNELTILTFNYESTMTLAARGVLESVIGPRTLMVLDESTRIKTPSAKRTRYLCRIGNKAGFKRIMSGLPVTQSPFDLYSQFRFLDPHILGFRSFSAFKGRYGEFETQRMTRGERIWDYEKLIRYQNLQELGELIRPHSIRRLKSECLDLPPKVYKMVPVILSPEQRKLYNSMDKDGIAEFDSFEVLAPTRLARLTKMQQIGSGFIYDESGVAQELVSDPKTELLLEVIGDHPGPTVIWTRFRHELAKIVKRLSSRLQADDEQVVSLHGGSDGVEKWATVKRFQEDDRVRFLVAQERVGIGFTLVKAKTVIYYSNEFSFEARMQSEDRTHRIGQTGTVVYVDLVCKNTVDERVLGILQRCQKHANEVLGDPQKGVGYA